MTRPQAPDDHRLDPPARIALLWALALDRFRDYVQGKTGTDLPGQEPTTPDDREQ